MSRVLVIDDEPNVLYSLECALRSQDLEVDGVTTGRQGLAKVRETPPDVVLLDVRLPDASGLNVFDEIRQLDAQVPVIMMTAFSTTDTAIEAMKRGAFEYLIKPVDLKQLRSVVGKAIELRRMSQATVDLEPVAMLHTPSDTIIGNSHQMQDVYKAIGRVAATDINVLILGESGTGKELVARAIHHHSRRSYEPLLAINCAAIPETLLESELFGHERGSFTGADRRRVGKFEQASKGTIFLDEIGDMTGATQAKVLRVLQDQRFERVGGCETVQTDARIIAATNQNLELLAASGRFRSDLFYRLKVYTIHLPALRERLHDLPLLIDHFIKIYNLEVGKSVRSVSPECLELMLKYPWPGNVRELQGALKNALVNATHDVITPDCLPVSIGRGSAPVQALPPIGHEPSLTSLVARLLCDDDQQIYHAVQVAVDRAVIEQVMRFVDGNQVEAARRLGISRTTLRAKLQMLAQTNSLQEQGTNEPGGPRTE